MQIAAGDLTGQTEDRLRFAATQPQCSQPGRRAAAEVGGGGEGVACASRRRWAGWAEGLGEAVQEHDPHVERQLLAGDGVDETFEEGWEPRWLEPAVSRDERVE